MEPELEADLRLVKTYKRNKRYKWRAVLYKKIAIALGVMLLGIGYLLFLAMKGNLALQKQVAGISLKAPLK